MSVWMSALVTGWFFWRGYIPNHADTTLYWLAFSAGAIALNQTFTKG